MFEAEKLRQNHDRFRERGNLAKAVPEKETFLERTRIICFPADLATVTDQAEK